MGKALKWLFYGFIGLTVLGLAIESSKTPEQKAAEQQARMTQRQQFAAQLQEKTKSEVTNLPSYTAHDLAQAYDENTVAADQLFKSKNFKVSGTVADINTDLFGNPYLTLRGGVNQFLEPQFGFDKGAAAQLGKLRKGMKVNLVCTGHGDVVKTPMSGDCTLL